MSHSHPDAAARLKLLNEAVVSCERCPRLREWCQKVAEEKRASFREDTYWGLPVPNFGDPEATGLIVGLAPAAHGANRTGRMFTGDRSGDWLYRGLHEVGLANQPTSTHTGDGLSLSGVLITAVNHCAPPDNKPTTEEIASCRSHLEAILHDRPWRAILCLGSIAWNETHRILERRPVPKFGHGVLSEGSVPIFASYHPSQQNTFTGRLTQEMLRSVLARFSEACR